MKGYKMANNEKVIVNKMSPTELKTSDFYYDLPEELVTKLIVTVEKNKHITRNSRLQKEFDKVMQQEWIHFDAIRDGMNNENN